MPYSIHIYLIWWIWGHTKIVHPVNFPSCWEITKIACLLNGHSWQAMDKYKHSLEIMAMTGDHPGTINCAQCQATDWGSWA